jgi:8-amino-3,8-dideoxy-alpha-D-manno-octulosonate transaminase
VTTGPLGMNNIPMTNWGMHLYYNNGSLVGKASNSASGRPWNDPLNAFAADYSYAKGTLPVLDDLVWRSSMLSIPPVLGEDAIVKIAAAFHAAAGV